MGSSRWPLRIWRWQRAALSLALRLEECVSMSAVSLAFDWHAPAPQPFTRCDGSAFWPGDRCYRPLLSATRTTRDLRALTAALPSALKPILRERFKPTRGPLRWDTPPALPTSIHQRYDPAQVRDSTPVWLCAQITMTAGMIERLLTAPEGMIGGLTHNSLFVMQLLRLRQLWEEVQRRAWEEDRLAVFTRALG
jgi:hypothetical protein